MIRNSWNSNIRSSKLVGWNPVQSDSYPPQSSTSAMGGKIDCYFDCVSPYSYFAFLYLSKNEDLLKTYGVDIEFVHPGSLASCRILWLLNTYVLHRFHPIFLGGVNVGSGNKPPWTLPAKAKYSTFDSARAKRYFGAPEISTPSFFPIL